ncbi:MAG TPA: discoidin domain-containing protein [Jatrophihabitantaceae bacterium]|jgi:hypothetical protein
MPANHDALSRRTFLSAGATVLATFGVGAALPGKARASAVSAPAARGADLAQYRPVRVSSVDYAPTPGQFAVDGLATTGVRGTGWRAAPGDPQWIAVDLQAPCSIEAVTLVFEATLDDPAFNGDYGHTTGSEILSSAAVSFRLDVSADGTTWTQAYATDSGTGATMDIALPEPVTARWIRFTSTRRANANPVGLNGFQVYGTSQVPRPPATGWTSWGGDRRPAPALTVSPDGTVPIESGWELTLDDFVGTLDGAALSQPTVPVETWLPAVVPGTVLASLVAAEHLPDPVAGFNNLQIPEALSRHAWWYRRVFALPSRLDTSAGRRIWLELDGINHQADVWLNGKNIGTLTHPFARAAFDVTSALAASRGQHSLAVQIQPMPHPGTPGDKSSNGNTFVQSGQLYLDSPTYLAASGWDWMPAVRDRAAGIWDHARLRSTGPVVISDPRVVTTLPAPGTAEVRITVPARNADSRDRDVTITASFDNVDVRRTVAVPAGQQVDVDLAPQTVHNPKLWWPNGYGEPALHELRITAATGGRTSDTRTTRFGIREFRYDYDEPIVVPPSSTPTFVVASGSDAPGQIVDVGAQQARYVRIQCGQRATQWGVSMWRLAVVNSSAPNVDRALHQTATASSDDGSPASNAVDGNNTTRWSSAYQDDQWIQVDLGAVTAFDQIQIAWEQAYALDFVVQVSDDGAQWTDVKSVDNAAALGDSYTQTETIAEQTARYLRVQCGGRATQWGVSMWTLSASSSAAPTVDLALHKTATASSNDGDNDAAPNAVDGNPRTRWSSAYQDNQWIQVDFGSPATFDQVAIAWEQAYARDYVIQVSDDGAQWTDVKSVNNAVTQLKISVNGVPVFCRGGNWGWDELLRRTDGRLETAVRMHRDMNFTMIRNWLGSSNRDELYRLCDENGILVWNDFWEAGAFNDNIPGYVDTAADTIRRYRTHPCIVVWCGANEEVPPAHLDTGMRQAVADEDGEVIYISNSAGGIVSGHGPYHWVDPASYFDKGSYDTNAFGFHTEIGMPVVPVTDSMQNLVGDEPGWPISEVWNYHDWSEIGNQQTGGYRAAIDARLGASTSLDEFCRRAQFVNYESTRAMFEAWNANLWRDATGLLLWMSHPAWHSTVWQTYDYDLDVNGAYYGSRKGCEPVHVQANASDWTVLAANHTPGAIDRATVTATVYDLAGKRLDRRQQTISVAASNIATAFTCAWKAGYPDLHLLRLELRDRHGALLSTNTYWRYRYATNVQALNALPRTRLTVTTRSSSRQQVRATVTNVGKSVAAMVRLSVRDRSGRRVLPAMYGDNYVWLLPGESREISVSWPADPMRPGDPRVAVDAYNASSVVA